jgi:tetratricopeptide (TPR) repeat protein
MNKKWTALSVVALLAIGGGAWQFSQGTGATPAELAKSGQAALQAGNKAQAKAAFEAALAKDPANFDALYGAGMLAFIDKRLPDAERYLGQANKAKPQDLQVLLMLAAVYQKWKKIDRAEALYRGILKADPKYYQARFNLGVLLAKSGDYAESQEHLEVYLKEVPDAKSRERAETFLAKVKAKATKE